VTKKVWAHAKNDSVGVAVEDIRAGEEVQGAIMHGGDGFQVQSISDVPLGHKIALKPIASGEKVLEYAEVIGFATQPIRAGEHVHVHNVRSLRWNHDNGNGHAEAAKAVAAKGGSP
jgi:(2R)-sulfolactate sulfo-lyase subunit alpha